MAPLARTLVLLAMAVATVAIKEVTLDMVKDSFDDQYLNCGDNMTNELSELLESELIKTANFAYYWADAMAWWKQWRSESSPLTLEQAIALMAYSKQSLFLYGPFNAAVREGGRSSRKYRDEFHYKSLHFLLTQALQSLRRPNDCPDVFWGVRGVHFKARRRDQVRIGQFALTSRDQRIFQPYGNDTMFKVRTCHGADIQKFSYYGFEKEVLIPPFETFEVTDVSMSNSGMHIELRSTGNFSNYNCEWLKGGSLPRTSPQLWGIFLVTMAMAAVSGAL